jgi:hypothetical protein
MGTVIKPCVELAVWMKITGTPSEQLIVSMICWTLYGAWIRYTIKACMAQFEIITNIK